MKFLIVIVLSLLGIAGSTEELPPEVELNIKFKFRLPTYMVKLEIPKPSGCMVCSGSFIFKNWILTDKECLTDVGYLVVYPAFRQNGYTVNKTNFFTRKYLKEADGYGYERHDIALIRFPYNESWAHILPARLPNAVDPSSAYYGKRAIFSGFKPVCTGNSSGTYVVLYLTILKRQACTLGSFLGFHTPLRERHLCSRTTISDLCQRGMGGQLVLTDSNELVGILLQPKYKSCSELIFDRINIYTQFIEFITGIDLPGGGWNKRHNATMQEKTDSSFLAN